MRVRIKGFRMKIIRTLISALLFSLLVSLLATTDRTLEALVRMDAILDKVAAEVTALTLAATNVRTPADAVVSIKRFSSIVVRLQNEFRLLGDAYADSLNASVLVDTADRYRRRMESLGKAYGRALGRFSPLIRTSAEFGSAFENVRRLGLIQ